MATNPRALKPFAHTRLAPALMLTALLAACGGGGSDTESAVSSTPSATPSPTPVAATPTPAPVVIPDGAIAGSAVLKALVTPWRDAATSDATDEMRFAMLQTGLSGAEVLFQTSFGRFGEVGLAAGNDFRLGTVGSGDGMTFSGVLTQHRTHPDNSPWLTTWTTSAFAIPTSVTPGTTLASFVLPSTVESVPPMLMNLTVEAADRSDWMRLCLRAGGPASLGDYVGSGQCVLATRSDGAPVGVAADVWMAPTNPKLKFTTNNDAAHPRKIAYCEYKTSSYYDTLPTQRAWYSLFEYDAGFVTENRTNRWTLQSALWTPPLTQFTSIITDLPDGKTQEDLPGGSSGKSLLRRGNTVLQTWSSGGHGPYFSENCDALQK